MTTKKRARNAPRAARVLPDTVAELTPKEAGELQVFIDKKTARRTRKPRAALVEFVARFHENERAGLKCSCAFPERCDGSGLVACDVYSSKPCECDACPNDVAEHVNACPGCEMCRASVCTHCGQRDPSVPAVEGEAWTCSPECTRATFEVVP